MTSAPATAWKAFTRYLSRAPATHVLFLVITVTTLVLRGVDDQTATRVLRRQSTNLVQMAHDAPRVLLLSAFLTTQGHLWWELVRFTVIFVPLERWVGTYRWMAVFAAGHVGASMATTLAIWLQATHGSAGRDVLTPVDVGISYGLAAAAGVVVYRLPRPLAIATGAVLLAWSGTAVVRYGTFTDWGHLTALAIGFGIGPIIRPQHPKADALHQRGGMPGALRSAWAWVATPPTPVRLTRARTAPYAAAVCFALTGALIVAIPTARHHSVAIPVPGEVVRATVVGPAPSCGLHCNTELVAYASAHGSTEALLSGVGDVLLRPGDRLAVRIDPVSPARASLAQPAKRVRVDGLVASAAVAAFGLGVALLFASRASRIHPVRTTIAKE